MGKNVDVIIPIHNEINGISQIVHSLNDIMKKCCDRFSIILVDDGSNDGSWEEIERISKESKVVRGIKFSRNFGKDAAIFAGIKNSEAELLITMDADGQHPVDCIPQMLDLEKSTGAAIINGIKRDRADNSVIYKLFAFIFNALFFTASGLEVKNSSDFKLLNAKAREQLLKCNDNDIFYRALCNWIGLKQTSFKFDVAERVDGEKSWNIKNLFRYAINAFIYHSDFPIKLILWMGGVVLTVSAYLVLAVLWNYFFGSVEEGYPTIILLLVMNSGLSLSAIGILGLYMRSTLNQTIKRPRYIIEEDCSGPDK